MSRAGAGEAASETLRSVGASGGGVDPLRYRRSAFFRGSIAKATCCWAYDEMGEA